MDYEEKITVLDEIRANYKDFIGAALSSTKDIDLPKTAAFEELISFRSEYNRFKEIVRHAQSCDGDVGAYAVDLWIEMKIYENQKSLEWVKIEPNEENEDTQTINLPMRREFLPTQKIEEYEEAYKIITDADKYLSRIEGFWRNIAKSTAESSQNN